MAYTNGATASSNGKSRSYSKRSKTRVEEKPRRKPEDILAQLIEWADMPNVAEELEESKLSLIGERVVREYEIDENSRKEWLAKAKKAMERANLEKKPKSYPWPDASNVAFPMQTTAALQFQARAYPAIVDGMRIVKCQVIGDDEDGAKRSKADRVSKHMSYQLINEMPEWEEDTDILLGQIPHVGCAFRKVFRDPVLKRNRAEMVSAIDLAVNQKTRSMETVPRATHIFTLYPHEVEERICDGAFLDCDLDAVSAEDDEDAPIEFLEQHRYLDLDDDGHREPWIVTVHKETAKVVRIVANYDPAKLALSEDGKRIGRIARYTTFVKYPFFRDPQGGFYDLGFGQLLDSLSEVIDSTINQMLDAGHLQNAGGGFIGSGLSLKKSVIRREPGKYVTVNSAGGKIRDAVYNHEDPGPSTVLFQLLGLMIEAGKEIASIKDILTGEVGKTQTATTTLALIEQGMKVYTSIYKRLYRALKKEYQLLFELNSRHLPEEQYYTVLDSRKAVKREDYDTSALDVAPVADPNVVTDMQKMMRAQIYREAAVDPNAKGIVDQHECWTRFFDAVGAEDVEKLILPKQEGPSPAEEMQMAGIEAEVKGKQAQAQKTGAEAAKTEAEAVVAQDQAQQVKKLRSQEEALEWGANMERDLMALMADGEDIEAPPPADMPPEMMPA